MTKRLIASIHDVGPRFESDVDQLADLYRKYGIDRFAMLVVPNHWGEAPLAENKAFQARLRGWANDGIEMFVHGWFHRDVARHKGMAGWKARHMTAGEGEFLGLSYADASFRMAEGKALIEDIIGRPVAGFVAPAWLYGPGAKHALADNAFAIAEDHFRVWQPGDGRIIAKGPVITWASRSTARIASSLAVARAAPLALRALPDVRVAVHPGDVHLPALVQSISRTVTALAKKRQISSYADLINNPAEQLSLHGITAL